MKFWLVFGAMVLLSPIPGLSGESTDYLITNSSLGRIRLEMTKHEVRPHIRDWSLNRSIFFLKA